MISSTLLLLPALAGLSAASPIGARQTKGPHMPKTVYGVDPTKPFYLTADTLGDNAKEYYLLPTYLDMTTSLLGLSAVEPEYAPTPRANYTLIGNHYGTQLYAYATLPCTSPTGCPGSSMLQWSNASPASGEPSPAAKALTFQQGVQQPSFGGLAFYGEYTGGDFEAGETNYLVGAGDSDFTKAWALCDYPEGNPARYDVLTYHGAGEFDAACKPVTVRASQVHDADEFKVKKE
ncbi:hypothetical protein PG996_002622 [Apiospora saccharicola]|uniref:Secreted protein n=1 Tax=Apiospora saccharicola TaxID=335842 RepID=A0ABR1WN08_9PEZI